MDRLELTLAAPAPERPEAKCRPPTNTGWIEPDEVARGPHWVLLLGVEADDDETSD